MIANSRLIVLFDHEIRLAAKMLMKVHALRKEADRSEQWEGDMAKAVGDALNACTAALYGADDESTPLVLSSLPALKLRAAMPKKDGVPAPR